MSVDGGMRWQAIFPGLPSNFVRALAIDGEGRIYAGTVGGMFVKTNDGTRWQKASDGLNNLDVISLAVDAGGQVYAGTDGGGVFVSGDQAANWKASSDGLTASVIHSLMVDDRGLVYAGTDNKNGNLYISMDRGVTWQSVSGGFPDTSVRALAVDAGRRLYAGMDGNVFVSDDQALSWKAVSKGLDAVTVSTLAVESSSGRVYAGTMRSGVFVSNDFGQNWQPATDGLIDTGLQCLASDSKGHIYLGTSGGGVFLSTDGGKRWQAASAGLSDLVIDAISVDSGDRIYIRTRGGGLFVSANGAANWQQISSGWAEIIWLFQRMRPLLRTSNGIQIGTNETGTLQAWIREQDFLQIRLWPLEDGRTLALGNWGATILKAELPTSTSHTFLDFVAFRAWLKYFIFPMMLVFKGWFAGFIFLLVILFFVLIYANVTRPLGLPMWAIFFARGRLDAYANPVKLEAAWQEWSAVIQRELLRFGDVFPDDLPRLVSLGDYAFRRYEHDYADQQEIELRGSRLRLLNQARLKRWHAAWRIAAGELGAGGGLAQPGRDAVDDLADALSNALGFTLSEGRDFEALRAYQVEAPALRLRLPQRFPLIFLADPQPTTQTAAMLVDAVDVLKESGYFALVVLLEPLVRHADAPARLRQALEGSPHVQDFIVLSQQDALDILIARHPAQALGRHITAQIDLSVISPFVIRGPVLETMFFGREAEVKRLVEGSAASDFALVGNRKIGKTSLLRRASRRLQESGRAQPLLLDCQAVTEAAGFYRQFEAGSGMNLPEPSPQGFAFAIDELKRRGPLPVLFVDEVDALLSAERVLGEPLVKTWRQLAQAGACHFVLCGASGLARYLEDAGSAFFNFGQPLPLGYLAPDVARLVLEQPFDALGLLVEEPETLLARAVELTSGHPNFLQYVGSKLVEAANLRGERRILLADLEALRLSNDFADYYLQTVWGEAGPLEKLITLLAPPAGFELGEMEDWLAERGVQVEESDLDAALKLLRVYAVLEKRGRRYEFTPRLFHELLERTQEVERLVRQEVRKLHSEEAQ